MGGRGSKGHSTSRGASKASTSSAATGQASAIRDRLAELNTRDEAARYLEEVKPGKAALLAAARELDIAVYDRDTTEDLKNMLIHATAGEREDAAAMQDQTGDSTPQEKPAQDVPQQEPETAPADRSEDAAPVWDAADAVTALKQETSASQATETLRPLTKAQLREMAANTGLKLPSNLTKDQMIHELVYQAITGPRTLERAQAGDPPRPEPTVPQVSSNPRKPNTWGGVQEDGAHTFHPDGAIGGLIGGGDSADPTAAHAALSSDQRGLQVRGDSLENVLGNLATETMAGRMSPQKQLDELKAIAAELPAGQAKSALSRVVEDLDAPRVDLGQRLTPEAQTALTRFPAVRTLLDDLNEIPLARGGYIRGDADDTREIDRITDALNQFGRAELGGMRFISAIESAGNIRHESREGKTAIDRAVQKALRELTEQQKADRNTFYPTKPQ